MNNGVHHPGEGNKGGNSFELPDGVDGTLLLDLIEDQPISPADRAMLGTWLVAHPSLARLVAQMRGDRAGVQQLARVKAPAGLLDGVEAMLEREALLGLASDEVALPAPIPISHFQPIIDRAERAQTWRRIGYGLAAAAGLAIVATISYVAVRDPGVPTRPSRADLVANNTKPIKATLPAVPSDLIAPDREIIAIAAAENIGPPSPADEVIEANLLSERQAIAAADAAAVEAATALVAAAPFGMPIDRAIALAREGRLLVTIKSASIDGATASLLRLKDKPLRGGRLRAIDTAQAVQITSAIEREWKREIDLAARLAATDPKLTPAPTPRINPVDVASGDKASAPLPIPAPEPQATPVAPQLVLGSSVFALECSADEHAMMGTLRGLRATLATGERIELAELTEPAEVGDVVDAAALMWWNTPSTWTKPLRAAVVVRHAGKQ